MTSGGARAHAGPAPDPNALRRDRPGDKGGWTIIPRKGREGRPAPEWPLTEAYPREVELWEAVWAKPQAVMWEKDGLEDEVALYVRRLAEVETFGAPVNLGTLVKQMQESLGISMAGLLRNRWKIEDDAPAAQPAAPRRRNSARNRLTVVSDED